jgi:histidinol dehydrogenase
MLLTMSASLISAVQAELGTQLADLPRREIAEKSLENSRIILMDREEEIIRFANAYAPEHLVIQCSNYGEIGKRIRHAGSVFLGPWSPESAGDYASGTNHTLPTGGHARAYSGLGLRSFMKQISFQEISREGLGRIGPAIIRMAGEEELTGHSRAVELRLGKRTEENT